MKRRNTFFTSDWHIGHANVIKYSSRPFTDVEHMSKVLVNNFNASAKPDSVTFFLGDMGWGSEQQLRDVITRLNGTKILVAGNHDKGYNAMLGTGFDAVIQSGSLIIANELVTFSHFPLLGVERENMEGFNQLGANWHGENKHLKTATQDRGQFHLHGHIHSPNGGRSERVLDRQMDVGVDANGYRPVSLSQIESWIAITTRNEKLRAFMTTQPTSKP